MSALIKAYMIQNLKRYEKGLIHIREIVEDDFGDNVGWTVAKEEKI
jgi:hypothetical protein